MRAVADELMAVVDERSHEAFADLAKSAHKGADPLYPFLESV